MPHIVLTPEQMQVVQQAVASIEVRDPAGKVLARILAPAEEELVARILARRGQDRETYPAEVVEARLRRLQEIRDKQGMDEATMWDLLRRMRAGEEV
jgi:hypothetical protein